MRPLKLELDGFLSYRQKTVVELDGAAAIAIVGENGAGKTSLIEAISWAIFGKGRGRGPDDFVSAGGTECRVAFVFQLDGETYAVERQRQLTGAGKSHLGLAVWTVLGVHENDEEELGWRPIGGDHIAETQAVIEQLLGLDYDTWEATAYIGQGKADRFTQMKPAARKDLLADVLGLSLYDALHEKAKARTRELGHEAEVLRRQIADLESQAASGEQDEDRLKGTADFLEHAAFQTRELEEQVAEARANLEEARAAAAGAEEALRIRSEYSRVHAIVEELERSAATAESKEAALQQARAEIEDAKRELAGARGREEGAQAALVMCDSALDQLQSVAATVHERLAAVERSAGAECFACGQGLDDVAREHLLDGLRTQLEELAEERLKQEAERHTAANDAAAYRMQKEIAAADLERIQGGISDLVSSLTVAKADERRVVGERQRLEQLGERLADVVDIDALQRRVQLSSETLAGYERRLADARQEHVQAERAHASAEERLRQVDEARARLEELSERQADVDHDLWIFERLAQAFGRDGIPALVIETAIPELEAHSNLLLQRLTAGRFTVRIDSLKATKTAGVKDTLDITVGDDVSERPLEALSGGERQCVDLALRVALSRLLAHRAGRRIQTLVIDEGFTALDVAHRQRTVQLLHDLLSEFETVLFVTHLRELADAFPARLQVVRDEAGSHVEVDAA